MKNNIKVKRFYRISVGSILIQAFLLLLFIAMTYLAIIYVFDIPTSDPWKPSRPLLIFYLICCIFVNIPISIYVTLNLYIGAIKVDEIKMFTIGDIIWEKNKIQYPTTVDFANISSLKIIPWQRPSNGRNNFFIRPVPFLEIKTKTGKIKIVRFALYFMSFRIVKSLLIEIMERCKKCDNPIVIDLNQAKKDFRDALFAVKE